jgi:hypothetical protein
MKLLLATTQNTWVEWLAPLLCILKVSGSNQGQETGYAKFFEILLSSSR